MWFILEVWRNDVMDPCISRICEIDCGLHLLSETCWHPLDFTTARNEFLAVQVCYSY